LLVSTNDTEIGLYDSNGKLIANDDDDGSSFLSLLSFGLGGADGDLSAGTYYLAAGGWNTSFADFFDANSVSTKTGTIQINFDTNATADAVPEPLTCLLFGGSVLAGLGRLRRRLS